MDRSSTSGAGLQGKPSVPCTWSKYGRRPNSIEHRAGGRRAFCSRGGFAAAELCERLDNAWIQAGRAVFAREIDAVL